MAATKVTDADRGSTLNVSVGDHITIALEEIPTTGYRWTVEKLDGHLLTLLNSEFSLDLGTGVGSGGHRSFVITAKQPGTTEIVLKLWREWGDDRSVIDRFQLRVNCS